MRWWWGINLSWGHQTPLWRPPLYPNRSGRKGRQAHSFFFLGSHLWPMEVPRLGVKSELQLLAHIPATATADPSHGCNLHHSSQHCQILNPLSEARD